MDTLDLDVNAGATVSRAFVLSESGAVVTPFVGGNLLIDATTPGLAAPFGTDVFRAQLVAGVGAAWSNGMSGRVEVNVARGATTTAVGATASLRIPID